jgi:moderate conductance mechanosensitive channel
MFAVTSSVPNPLDVTTSATHDERLFDVLQRDWHADLIDFIHRDLPKLVFVFLLAFILLQIVNFFVRRMRRLADSQVANQKRASQLRTMASVIRATSYFFVIFFFLMQVLPIFNIDLKPLLASAGVIGLGISFGAQSIFKDMLTGIFILIEDQYNVGDMVKIAGLQGNVEDMTLRVTTLRDGDGTLNIIPNSQVATVQNLSRQYSVATLNVSVDSSANPDTVMAALREIANDVRKDKAFADVVLADPEILGVDKIAGREVVYPVNMRVRANQKDGVLREMRRRIILYFDKNGIPLGNTQPTLILQKDPTQNAQAPTLGS